MDKQARLVRKPRLMNPRLAAAVCWLFFACPGLALAKTSTWNEYVYVDDGFAISGPVQPTRETKTANAIAVGEIEMHVYTVLDTGDASWAVVVSKYPHSAVTRLDIPRALADGKRGVLDRLKLRFVRGSEVGLTLGNYQGLQFDAENSQIYYRGRVYFAGDRLYQLISITPAGKPVAPETGRFFQSFRLLSSAR